jgi:hypothetical protein
MRFARTADVLIVSLGSTEGLRSADEQLAQTLERAGASVEIARARRPREVRTLMLTDLQWARAARTAALDRLSEGQPRAMLYSTTTAALLWPRAGAIRFDATARGNRPGRHGLWQRPLERRRLAQSPLLLPLTAQAMDEAPRSPRREERTLVMPIPVAPSGPVASVRDIAAITYGANPSKKGLDLVLAAWRRLRSAEAHEGDELLVAGVEEADLLDAGMLRAGEPGVRVVGRLPAAEYRAVLRRARVFVCAPRREDYGTAQLEALADGCMLVTTGSPGPYAALPIARQLDPRLVGPDIEGGMRTALREPLPGYAERALRVLAPFSPAAVDELVAERLLPRLLAEGSQLRP